MASDTIPTTDTFDEDAPIGTARDMYGIPTYKAPERKAPCADKTSTWVRLAYEKALPPKSYDRLRPGTLCERID